MRLSIDKKIIEVVFENSERSICLTKSYRVEASEAKRMHRLTAKPLTNIGLLF